MMLIIADSSALIALSTCGALPLLDGLFDSVLVPPAVFQECTATGKPEASQLREFLKNNVVESVLPPDKLELPDFLGAGELEAMRLYRQTKADYLLIDDGRARKIAVHNKITIVGSLGILLVAKEQQLIDNVTKYIDRLAISNLYFSEKLLNDIKERAGE